MRFLPSMLCAVALLGACADEPLAAAPRVGVVVRGSVSGTGSGGLLVRARPNTSAPVIATLAEGAAVDLTCQIEGESVDGNRLWDFVQAERGYVADAFIKRASATALPVCGAKSSGTSGVDPDDSASAVIIGPEVRAHVRAFADEACRTVDACRAATREGHEPSADLALDFNVSEAFGKLPTDNYAFGDRLAAFALSEMSRYRIEYVIFRQRYNDGSGWAPMEDRGSITENHFDHVHVSFLP